MNDTHVLHISKHLGRGGAEVLLAETQRASHSTGFRYSYGYFLRGNNALEEELVSRGSQVVCFGVTGSIGVLMSVLRVIRHVRSVKPDIIHCHLPLPGVVGRIVGAIVGVPVVYTEHNVLTRYHRLTRLAARLTWRLQDHVIAVSDDVREAIHAYHGESVPVRVIRNGISVDRFRRDTVSDDVRTRLGVADSATVIATVAVFRPAKRLDLWIDIAASTLRDFPTAVFVLIGYGPLEKDLRRRVQEHGLDDRILFAGAQADVRPYLKATDIYLMTSLYEGLPVALLEAMAMQCVPVCTLAGGISEAICHGQNGLGVAVDTPERLLPALRSVIENGPQRRMLAENARKTVEDRFSIDRMVSEIHAVYDHILTAN